jgi:hypothetical protein
MFPLSHCLRQQEGGRQREIGSKIRGEGNHSVNSELLGTVIYINRKKDNHLLQSRELAYANYEDVAHSPLGRVRLH